MYLLEVLSVLFVFVVVDLHGLLFIARVHLFYLHVSSAWVQQEVFCSCSHHVFHVFRKFRLFWGGGLFMEEFAPL